MVKLFATNNPLIKKTALLLSIGLATVFVTNLLEILAIAILLQATDLGGTLLYTVATTVLGLGHSVLFYVFIATLLSYVSLKKLKFNYASTIAFLAGGISSILTVALRPQNGDIVGAPNASLLLLIPAAYLFSGYLVGFFATSKKNALTIALLIGLPLYALAPFAGTIQESIGKSMEQSSEQDDATKLKSALYDAFIPFAPPGTESIDIRTDTYYYSDNSRVIDDPQGIKLSVLVDYDEPGVGATLWQSKPFKNLNTYISPPEKCNLKNLSVVMNDLRKYAASDEIVSKHAVGKCRKIGTTSNGRVIWGSDELSGQTTYAHTQIDTTLIVIFFKDMSMSVNDDAKIMELVESLSPLDASKVQPSTDFSPHTNPQ